MMNSKISSLYSNINYNHNDLNINLELAIIWQALGKTLPINLILRAA